MLQKMQIPSLQSISVGTLYDDFFFCGVNTSTFSALHTSVFCVGSKIRGLFFKQSPLNSGTYLCNFGLVCKIFLGPR